MKSKPEGTTRASMRQAMAMHNPRSARVKSNGELFAMPKKKTKPELPGQRDVFDCILEAEAERAAEA